MHSYTHTTYIHTQIRKAYAHTTCIHIHTGAERGAGALNIEESIRQELHMQREIGAKLRAEVGNEEQRKGRG
jgi:hypothetical protein